MEALAALVRANSSLSTPEIAGLLGITLEAVPQDSSSGDPPWEFAHPTLDETMRIRQWVD
ncbi:hypothetical protein HSEST_3060 (plasmid) [Halapricum desulfuricans]|uniref:Uncharacterized protein n=1 Tax=Halapricum desulfuricans TaxID=2841257 RepID=A0A897NV57_9EURY|nr:hypothetical protein HSEST_3060 [Halapricum desulfuricans]